VQENATFVENYMRLFSQLLKEQAEDKVLVFANRLDETEEEAPLKIFLQICEAH